MKTSLKTRCQIILALSYLALIHLLSMLVTIPTITLVIVWTAYLILSVLVEKHLPLNYISLITCTALCTDTATKIVLLVLVCLISYQLINCEIKLQSKVVSVFMHLFLLGIIVCVSNISFTGLGFVNVLAGIGLSVAYFELWKEALPDELPDNIVRGY